MDIYTIMGQERAYYYFASVTLLSSYWTCILSGHRQKCLYLALIGLVYYLDTGRSLNILCFKRQYLYTQY